MSLKDELEAYCTDFNVKYAGKITAGPNIGKYAVQDNGKTSYIDPITKTVDTSDEKLKHSLEKWLASGQSTPIVEDGDLDVVEEVDYRSVTQTKPTPPETSTQQDGLYERLVALLDYDLLEVFGETGTGKTKAMVAIALDAARSGKKVFYLDTERNLTRNEVSALVDAGAIYKYTPILKEVTEIVYKQLQKWDGDLFILDSVGLPVLRKFAMMSAKDRGEALLDVVAILGALKEWSYLSPGLAMVTNQPQSRWGKVGATLDNRGPFGDKSAYIPTMILSTKKVVDGKDRSSMEFKSWRSRDYGKGELILKVEVAATDVDVQIVCEAV